MASKESHLALLTQLACWGLVSGDQSSVHLGTSFPRIVFFADQMQRKLAPPTLGISPGLSTLHSPKLELKPTVAPVLSSCSHT